MASANSQPGAFSHLSGTPITINFAVVIAFALLALFLLRHFFGNIRVEAGTH